jgi:hypothetical protein
MARNILVINVDFKETRVALIEDGVIAELQIERAAHRSTVGNIVLGRVTRVLPGMQAAFIDVGQERAAFLHVEDLIRPDDFDAYLASDAREKVKLKSADQSANEEDGESSEGDGEGVPQVSAGEASTESASDRGARRGRRRRGRRGRGRDRVAELNAGDGTAEAVGEDSPVDGDINPTLKPARAVRREHAGVHSEGQVGVHFHASDDDSSEAAEFEDEAGFDDDIGFPSVGGFRRGGAAGLFEDIEFDEVHGAQDADDDSIDEEPADEELGDEDLGDEDLDDEDLGDEDLGDEDLGDEDLGDEDLGDEDLDDESLDDEVEPDLDREPDSDAELDSGDEHELDSEPDVDELDADDDEGEDEDGEVDADEVELDDEELEFAGSDDEDLDDESDDEDLDDSDDESDEDDSDDESDTDDEPILAARAEQSHFEAASEREPGGDISVERQSHVTLAGVETPEHADDLVLIGDATSDEQGASDDAPPSGERVTLDNLLSDGAELPSSVHATPERRNGDEAHGASDERPRRGRRRRRRGGKEGPIAAAEAPSAEVTEAAPMEARDDVEGGRRNRRRRGRKRGRVEAKRPEHGVRQRRCSSHAVACFAFGTDHRGRKRGQLGSGANLERADWHQRCSGHEPRLVTRSLRRVSADRRSRWNFQAHWQRERARALAQIDRSNQAGQRRFDSAHGR